jgi:hypothetical protein
VADQRIKPDQHNGERQENEIGAPFRRLYVSTHGQGWYVICPALASWHDGYRRSAGIGGQVCAKDATRWSPIWSVSLMEGTDSATRYDLDPGDKAAAATLAAGYCSGTGKKGASTYFEYFVEFEDAIRCLRERQAADAAAAHLEKDIEVWKALGSHL